MKCPVCDKNQIDPTDNPFMCPECFKAEDDISWSFVPWEDNMDNPELVSVIYDEDDYKSRSEIALGVD